MARGETKGASSSDLCLNELMKISTQKKILACSQRVYRYPFSETIGASSADLCLLFYYRAAATLLVQRYFTSADSVRTISMRDVHDFSAVPLA